MRTARSGRPSPRSRCWPSACSNEDAAAMCAPGVEVVVDLHTSAEQHSGKLLQPENPVGALQARHLATPHRRLGYASYPDDDRVAVLAQPRLQGVREVCSKLGLPEPEVRRVPLRPDGAAAAVRSWLAADPPAESEVRKVANVQRIVARAARPTPDSGITHPPEARAISRDSPSSARQSDACSSCASCGARKLVSAADPGCSGGRTGAEKISWCCCRSSIWWCGGYWTRLPWSSDV
jgi:hypothetical protein